MADPQPSTPKPENDFAQFAKDLAKLIGKFMLDLGRLAVRGLWQAYRAIGRRRVQDAQDGTRANAIMDDIRERFQRDTPAATTDTPTEQDADIPVTGTESYVDMDAAEDHEAAAMLDDLLRETAATSPPSDQNTAPAVEQTDLSYKADDTEQAKIEAQLRDREALLRQEQTERKAVTQDKDAKQAEIRAAMEADKARIREEQRRRQQAFQQAEAERKARERQKQETVHRARLLDDPPEDDTDATTNQPDTHQQQHKD